jgi:acetyltransferase
LRPQFKLRTAVGRHKGLGAELYRQLIQIGRDEKLKRVVSNMLPENREMRAVCVKHRFKMYSNVAENMIRAELDL